MLLKLKTLTPFLNLVAPVFPNSKPRGPSEIRFSKRWGNNLLSLSLLDHQRCRRDQIRYCWMAGGGGGGYHDEVRVWWDLNRCPVPAGVDPRRVRQCIESALEKQIGRRCAVSIVAIGNLEYTSCDLLEKISSSGIILIHIALGRKDMYGFLKDWSDNATNAHRHIMIISDALLCHRDLFQRYRFYATYVAYPKGARLFTHPNTLQLLSYQFQAFAKEFVWETLLSDNLDETLLSSDNNNNTCDDDEEPLYSCNICSFDSQVCDEFITHFKSEEHRNMLYDTVGSSRGKIVHFCKVCNYPAYNEYNLFLHNQSEEHNRKAQEEEDCESSKTNPELDLLYYERNKKESLSMSLKLNTPHFPNLAVPFLFPNSNPKEPSSEIQFSKRWGNANAADLLSLSLLDHQRCRRDQIRGGGGDHHDVVEARVWWDLNTCPVPAGVDPRRVRQCIESALEKQIRRRCAVSIYATGNLEYTSSDLLEKISSSGIILTHAPCGKNDLYELLDDWSDDELKNPYPPSYIMMISSDYDMLNPERFRCDGFTNFVAYPKDARLAAPIDKLKLLALRFAEVFAKQFVWETLFSKYLGETLLLSDNNTCDEKPLCICNICNDVYDACDEFITHLKSEEHKRNQLFETVVDQYGKRKYFCQVCNCHLHGEDIILLHNHEHNCNLVEKQAQEEEDCERRKTNPELDFFCERNKKQSL